MPRETATIASTKTPPRFLRRGPPPAAVNGIPEKPRPGDRSRRHGTRPPIARCRGYISNQRFCAAHWRSSSDLLVRSRFVLRRFEERRCQAGRDAVDQVFELAEEDASPFPPAATYRVIVSPGLSGADSQFDSRKSRLRTARPDLRNRGAGSVRMVMSPRPPPAPGGSQVILGMGRSVTTRPQTLPSLPEPSRDWLPVHVRR